MPKEKMYSTMKTSTKRCLYTSLRRKEKIEARLHTLEGSLGGNGNTKAEKKDDRGSLRNRYRLTEERKD